jgi:predicted anti-sigma-YlaC factor YlaD
MDCQFINENVIDYLEKQLSREDLEKFEAHLADCKGCQQLVADIRLTYMLAVKPQDFRVSENFVDKTVARVKRNEARLVPLVYRVLKPLAVAASIGFGILIGNGELAILDSNLDYAQDETIVLTVSTPSNYSVWQTLEEDYGTQD